MISFLFSKSIENLTDNASSSDLIRALEVASGTVFSVVESEPTSDYVQVLFSQDAFPILERLESEMLQYGSTFYLDHERLKPSFQAFPLIRRYRQEIISEDGLIEASKRIWNNYFDLVKNGNELSKEYENQSVTEMILLSLWLARMTLTERQTSGRSKPIIVGNLCQFLTEIRNLPDYEVWKGQCDSVLQKLLIETYPELKPYLESNANI